MVVIRSVCEECGGRRQWYCNHDPEEHYVTEREYDKEIFTAAIERAGQEWLGEAGRFVRDDGIAALELEGMIKANLYYEFTCGRLPEFEVKVNKVWTMWRTDIEKWQINMDIDCNPKP